MPLLPPLLIQPPPRALLPMPRHLLLPLQQHRSRNSFALIHTPERTAFGLVRRAVFFKGSRKVPSLLVSIRDCRHSKKDRQWIQDVYGEYVDALSDLNTGLFSVLGADNPRAHEIFANWFANDQSHPLLILKGPDAVGFALVTRPRIPAAGETSADYHMSEFFVRKAYRRTGIGRDAATLIFDRFAGDWEIVEYQRNPSAIAFWRRVLTTYDKGLYTERSRHGEVHHRFTSRTRPRR